MLRIAGLLCTGGLMALASVQLLAPAPEAPSGLGPEGSATSGASKPAPWRFEAFAAEFHALNRQLALLQKQDETQDPLQEYRNKSAAIRLIKEAQATLPIALTLRTPRGIWDLDLPIKPPTLQKAQHNAAPAGASAAQPAEDLATLSAHVATGWGWTLSGKARVLGPLSAQTLSLPSPSSANQRLLWLALLIASSVALGLQLARRLRDPSRVMATGSATASGLSDDAPDSLSMHQVPTPRHHSHQQVLRQHHDLRAQLSKASEELALITQVMQERREARQPSKV